MQEKAEAKVQKVQERAEAERRAKAEKTKEWHKQQHEREQARIQVACLDISPYLTHCPGFCK